MNTDTYIKAFRASPAAICISTLKEGKFVEVNESFCKLSGYSRDELIGKTSTELNMWGSSDDRTKVTAALAENGSIPEYENRLMRKEGEFVDCVGSVEVIDIDGEACLLTILLDSTDRKRTHVQLHEAKDAAE